MAFSAELKAAFDRLNPEQRAAVETLDGPVLVVAGPGTGKTQLLSLRVANILETRDVAASNILCLTFTEAGSDAMSKRLAGLIGRDAYAVHIATFHSFAAHIRNRYPAFFERSAFDAHITNLQSKKLIESLLKELPVDDPLYERPFNGRQGQLSSVASMIGTFKKSGLEPDDLRRVFGQNLAFFSYIEEQTELLDRLNAGMPRAAQAKRQFLDDLQDYAAEVCAAAPAETVAVLTATPGVYVPYATYLAEYFASTLLYEEGVQGIKSTGFTELRKALFRQDRNKVWRFKDQAESEKLLSATTLYERYLRELDDGALYDFDDMILDAIKAIEAHDELRYALQEQYHYVLVDEFQDTNGAQMRLLDLVLGDGERPNVLAVGDDDQAIMRFQGASVEFLNQFERHYAGVQRIVLKTNYRSTSPLVALGQTVATQIENRSTASATEKKLVAHRGEGGANPVEAAGTAHSRGTADGAGALLAIAARSYASKDVEYYEVARALRARIDAGFIRDAPEPKEAIAVIAAKHRNLAALIPYLKAFDIAYDYRVSTSVLRIESLQTLFALIKFVDSYSNLKTLEADAQLPQILASPEFGFAAQEYFGFALAARASRVSWLENLRADSDKRRRDLADWLVDVARRALVSPARQIISELAKPLIGYYQTLEDSDPFTLVEFNYGLARLLEFTAAEYEATRALGLLDQPLRLRDVVELLKDADTFGEELSISLPLQRPDAVTLTSAHSSKGLEFDLVYLLDADRDTWHRSSARGLSPSQNLLFGNAKDANDVRRTLFVALTRARFELEVVLGKGEIVPELLGELAVEQVATSVEDIVQQSAFCWQDDYYPHDATLLEVLRPGLAKRKMSVSLLNKFLDYDAEDPLKRDFVLDRLLNLPSEPSANLAFGSCVHAALEDYLDKIVLSSQTSLDELIQAARTRIAALDFEEAELEHMRQRFDLFVRHFLPGFRDLLASLGTTYRGEQTIDCVVDGIPLTGRCDLLAFDETSRTIKVLDYKTGKAPATQTPTRDYLRQLQFYKLLIENAPEYEGWTVLGGADIHVEPVLPAGECLKPQLVTVSEGDLEHLRCLIQAVWQRIQSCDFAVQAFEESRQLADLRARNVTLDGRPKAPTKAQVAEAFEYWLIEGFGCGIVE